MQLAAQAGLQPRITSTRRTRAEQKRLYENYLAGRSAYPAAPPGTSAHEFGFAFDMVVNDATAYADLGAVWTDNGGVWHSSDEIHFEYPGFTPDQPTPVLFPELGPHTTLLSQVVTFLPYIGPVTLTADIIGALGLSENAIVDVLSNPDKLLRYVPQWQVMNYFLG